MRLQFLPLLLSLFLCAAPNLSAQVEAEQATEPPRIRKLIVNFTGLSNVNEEVARANMSVREGELYDQVTIDRDIRSLYRTGLFEHVEVRFTPVTEKEIDIVFDIRPKFRIASIGFDGNESVRDFRLEREITIEVNHVLNERNVKQAAQDLHEFYVKRGYSQARVTYEIDRNPATGFGNVIFKIAEGRKFKIAKVTFDGNEDLKAKRLRRKMETKKWGFLSVLTGSGKFDSDKFEDDIEKLKDVYRNEGYLDVEIDPDDVTFSYPSKKRMVIDVDVEEGKQYRVGNIEFDGNEIFKDDILRLILSVHPGDIYKPEKLEEDVERVEDYYGTYGYMESRVRLNRVPNMITGNIDLAYQIYESEKFDVESVDIEGNTKTKSTVVIRELALGPGSTFDSVRMEASRMRLENTRYFDDVNVTPQTTNIPGKRDLRVTFREGRTGNFSFGAGFSSLEKGVFFIELTQSNFDILNWRGAFQGDGQKFRLKAQFGSRSTQTLISFEEPWFLEKRLAVGFSLFSTTSSLSGLYEVEQKGYEVYMRKRLIELINARVSYSSTEYSYSNFDSRSESPTVGQQVQLSNGGINSVNLQLERDSRDRYINTYSGARYELDLTTAGGALGGDFEYWKVESRNAYYFPISRWHRQTIEFLVRAGVVQERGGSTTVPYEERFYLGGPNTLRGFEFRDVSPKEGGSNFYRPVEVGGKTYGMFGAEYSIGFTEGFRGAIFYDGGFVNKEAGDFGISRRDVVRNSDGVVLGWRQSGWNDNFGVGIRISVMGTPLRLDYAIPMTTSGEPDLGGNDNGSQFNFTFGGRF